MRRMGVSPPVPSVLPSLYASLILQSTRFLDVLQASPRQDRLNSCCSGCLLLSPKAGAGIRAERESLQPATPAMLCHVSVLVGV